MGQIATMSNAPSLPLAEAPLMPTGSRTFSGLLQTLGAVFANVCGYILLALALLVTFETLGRKFLNISLQGVDELGGYVLAVTSSLAFTLALLDRAHIRIDLFHLKLPRGLRAALNWISAAMTTAFAALLVYVGVIVLRETVDFGSTAPTRSEE